MGETKVERYSGFSQLWLKLLVKFYKKHLTLRIHSYGLPRALEGSRQVRSPRALVCHLHGKTASGQGLGEQKDSWRLDLNLVGEVGLPLENKQTNSMLINNYRIG